MRSDATASVNCGKRCNSMMLTLLLVLFGLLPAYGDQKSIEFRKKTVQLLDSQGWWMLWIQLFNKNNLLLGVIKNADCWELDPLDNPGQF